MKQCGFTPPEKVSRMTADICYLEKSRFLADALVSQFSDLRWSVNDNETTFLRNLFDDPPLLLIIGDTSTANALELLYCLKSLKGFNRLPVIFYGENEFSHILPVNKVIPRNPEALPELKKIILRFLKLSRQNIGIDRAGWSKPERSGEPDFLQKQARNLLGEEMFRKHLYSEIAGMNITDLSFGDFLDKLGSRLEALLSLDFVSILYNHEKKTYRRLILAQKLSEKDISKICEECVHPILPGTGRPVIGDDAVSFRESAEIISERIKISVFLNETLTSDGVENGRLIMGSLENSSSHIPRKLVSHLSGMVGEIIEQAARYYVQVNETKLIYKAFSQFLPTTIINDLLLKESEKALLTGEKRRIVVLFSHVRNFDHIVEHNEPQKVVEFLNSHFTNMVRIIQKHGGSIDKFIGDAVFAIFGAPISYIDNTKRAVDASLEMIRRYKEIKIDNLILPDNNFSIGVGLNEGEAIIGNIGCADKFDYTAIGDTVNLAARLESLTKHYRQDILISKIVFQQIQKEYYCRLIDRAKVKGKNEATEIYSLPADPAPYTDKWKQLYSRGLKMYSLGNWYTAEEYLRECLKILPADIVCEILLKRCTEFQASPPEDWNGAVTLNFK